MLSAELIRRSLTDPALLPILDKVEKGDRLDAADGLQLLTSPDLNGVGCLASIARLRRHGRKTFYVLNQHINYTNVCNKHCLFCYFARSPKDGGPDPYTLTHEEVRQMLKAYAGLNVHEVHIVGGVNPRLPYGYYLGLLEAVREVRPGACIKAFTAVELAQIASVAGKPLGDVLEELKEAGLNAVPGGGAEVLSDRIHAALYPHKLTPDEWLEVSRAVARAGLAQYATMLYGHIEEPHERVEHLLRLRALQDETNHFLAFTPLSFHPEGTYLSDLPGPTGHDDLRMIAVSRLMLDNFPHIKTFWIMNTPAVSQVAQWYGADDMDGTVEEYQITFEEGRFGDRRQCLPSDELRRLITEAGFEPVMRDGLYREVTA